MSWLRTAFEAGTALDLLPTDLVVVLSGLVELALGEALIALSRYRIKVGWLAACFVA